MQKETRDDSDGVRIPRQYWLLEFDIGPSGIPATSLEEALSPSANSEPGHLPKARQTSFDEHIENLRYNWESFWLDVELWSYAIWKR